MNSCGTTSGEPSRRSLRTWLHANSAKTGSEGAIETITQAGQSSWRPWISGNISISMATSTRTTPMTSIFSGCGDFASGR